eukprot:Rhum_TRINITY_DN7120_c0_g1::Rhum_TRINITY_DN7120_c0_g1_i1::g.21837::m.21837
MGRWQPPQAASSEGCRLPSVSAALVRRVEAAVAREAEVREREVEAVPPEEAEKERLPPLLLWLRLLLLLAVRRVSNSAAEAGVPVRLEFAWVQVGVAVQAKPEVLRSAMLLLASDECLSEAEVPAACRNEAEEVKEALWAPL